MMKSTSRVRSLFLPLAGLIALGSLAAAQSNEKPIPHNAHDAALTKPKEAAAREMATHLKLEVTGLTKENSETIRTALMALQVSDYACKHCDVHMAMAGKCTACGGELKVEKVPMFGAVQPAAEAKTLALTLSTEHPTRRSEIQAALRAQSLTLTADTLPVAGQADLWISGGTAESVAPLKKALETSKLFETAQVSWNAAAKELRVLTQAGAKAPTDSKVQEVLQGLKLKLDDIVWNDTPARS